MLRQNHRQIDKHVIVHIIQPIVKINPIVYIKTLMTEIKTFMNYTLSYKKICLAKQTTLEMIHANEEESYFKRPKVIGALQYDCGHCSNSIGVWIGRNDTCQKKYLNVPFGHSVHALMGLYSINSSYKQMVHGIWEVCWHIIDGYSTRQC